MPGQPASDRSPNPPPRSRGRQQFGAALGRRRVAELDDVDLAATAIAGASDFRNARAGFAFSTT